MNRYSRYMFFAILVSFIIAITGCRTVSAPSDPTGEWIPPQWEQSAQSNDPVWNSIREQQIDTTEPLTLTDLINVALINNPSTRQSWEDALAASAGVKQAQSLWYPQAKVSVDVNRIKSDLNRIQVPTSEATGDIDDLTINPGAQLTFLLLDFGGRSATIEEAVQILIAANYQFNQALQDLLLNVETAYYDLYSAEAEVNAAEADVEDAFTSLDAAKKRLDSGLGTRLDVLQAQSNYDESLYSLEEAKGAVKTAHAMLAQTLGLPADTDFKIAEPSGELPTDLTEENITSLINTALKDRSDIAALRASFRAQEAAVKVANSSLWPSVSLGASADWYRYHYYDSDIDDEDAHQYAGFVNVTWDIFDGFYNLSIKRAAQAELASQHAQLIEAEIAASADVWTSYYNYRTAIQKLFFGEAFFLSSEESYELAIKSYNSGLNNILDVFQAQSNLSSARSNLIQSRKDIFVAIANLAYATGTLYKIDMEKIKKREE